VPLDLDMCPTCGVGFLAALADAAGRHRSAAAGGIVHLASDRFPRPVRLAVGAGVGLLLAVLIPVLLALFS
jgi:hypothetical protein